MIQAVRITNFKSIHETIELDFKKGSYKFYDMYIKDGLIINPAFIYGYNATGKSNILNIFSHVHKLLTANLNTRDDQVAFVSHAFLSNPNEPTVIEFDFNLNGYLYTYVLKGSNHDLIIKEELFHEKEDLLAGFRAELHDINQITYQNPLLKEVANSGRNDALTKEVNKVYQVFVKMFIVHTFGVEINGAFQKRPHDMILDNQIRIREILAYISDVPAIEFKKETLGTSRLLMVCNKDLDPTKYFPINDILSDGTIKIYELIAMLLEIESGSTMIIDEVENALHPDLLKQLVKVLNEEFDVQFIFSSHDISLMEELRPDQIYLTFIKQGNTTIKRVSNHRKKEEYKLRQLHNLKKLYEDNEFGIVGKTKRRKIFTDDEIKALAEYYVTGEAKQKYLHLYDLPISDLRKWIDNNPKSQETWKKTTKTNYIDVLKSK